MRIESGVNTGDPDLDLARHLAALGSAIALDHLRRGVQVERKPDGSPVTAADREVELRLREVLAEQRPEDAILGEEFGALGNGARRWIIDPIDGTSNFVAGRPFWGTHVALERDGEIVLGVITRPAHGSSWWASRELGAFRNDASKASGQRKLQVSSRNQLEACRVTAWTHHDHPVVEPIKRSTAWIEPNLDALLRLAEGDIDAVVVCDGKPWDHAPAVVIVEAAGGSFSDPRGGRRIDLEEAIYTNGHIHEPVLRLHEASLRTRRDAGR